MSTACKGLFGFSYYSQLARIRPTINSPSLITRHVRKQLLQTQQAAGTPDMSFSGHHGTQVLADRLDKPLLDDRSYRVIRLPNQLEALLIHDKNTDKASAAVDVNAGSLSDEVDLPGMAHAVEHMLFMGNEKYPGENDYQQYLSAYSGSHNAFTAQTSTNYFFEMGLGSADSTADSTHHVNGASVNGTVVNGSSADGTTVNAVNTNDVSENGKVVNGSSQHDEVPFYGALDRFSQFFVSPLFLEGSLDRELRAVDSENKKNLQSDVWRLQQLKRSLSNPDHPNCNFSTGNLQTLRDEPLARGVKIRSEFMRFYDEQYSANRMKLAVLGRESLDELQTWVEELFGSVRNKNLPKLRWDMPIYTENELLTEIFVKPVMDTRTLELSFTYPDEEKLWESLPGRYIGHLVGYEGPGSIFAYIKDKGWANSLSAGARSICPGTGVFEISVGLTLDGLKHYREVVQSIFQYLSILHESEPKEWIFDELKRMSEVDFKFKQKSPASSTASVLAGVMQSPIPRELLVSGKSIVRAFNPEAIRKGISCLNPKNFRLVVVSKEPLQGDVKKEKWYGTEYTIKNIDEDFLASIQQAFGSSTTNRPEALHLPTKNEFIPTKLEVEKKPVDTPLKTPKLVRNDGNVRLWYKKDDQFWVPKANFFLRLRNPICGSTPRNTVLTMLYTRLVEDSLMEFAYDAEIAGLDYSLDSSLRGLSVMITGYNDKMPVLLEKVLGTMRDIQISDDRFEIIKEKLARGLRNRGYSSPYQQIGEYVRWLSTEKGWIDDQLLVELEDLVASDVRAFQPLLLGQMHLESLAHGNLHREDALKLVNLAERTLKPRHLPAAQWPITRSLLLPAGSDFVYARDLPDPANINHAIEYVLQIGEVKDRKKRATLLLLDQMTREPAFDRLRTKEQLGYVVFSGSIRNGTVLSYRFIIQSERTPEYLEERIENFLRVFKEELLAMKPETFEAHKRSKINERLEKEKNLTQESMRFWSHISNEVFHFAEMEDDAARLKSLTKDDVIAFFNHYIDPSSPARAKTSIYLRAKASPADLAAGVSPEEQKTQFIELVEEYLNTKGIQPDTAKLDSRFAKVDFSGQNQEPMLSALASYIREDSGVSASEVPGVVEEANNLAASALSQLGISPTELNGAPNGEKSKIQGGTFIEDVHAYKASMPLTAGASPIRPLSEFEDLGAKL